MEPYVSSTAGILEDDKHVDITTAATKNGKERSNIVEAQPDLFTSLLSKVMLSGAMQGTRVSMHYSKNIMIARCIIG